MDNSTNITLHIDAEFIQKAIDMKGVTTIRVPLYNEESQYIDIEFNNEKEGILYINFIFIKEIDNIFVKWNESLYTFKDNKCYIGDPDNNEMIIIPIMSDDETDFADILFNEYSIKNVLREIYKIWNNI